MPFLAVVDDVLAACVLAREKNAVDGAVHGGAASEVNSGAGLALAALREFAAAR
jgi:hypothetical protein